MKFVSKWISLVTLCATVLILGGCGGDDKEKTEEELQLDKLRGTWILSGVENDGVDRSDEYTNMTVTFAGSYTEGGVYNVDSQATEWPSISPWSDDDTWKFAPSSVSTLIVRQSDLQEMTYTLSNSDTQLRIEFTYTGPGFNNGRTSSVGGGWEFTFSKQ